MFYTVLRAHYIPYSLLEKKINLATKFIIVL